MFYRFRSASLLVPPSEELLRVPSDSRLQVILLQVTGTSIGLGTQSGYLLLITAIGLLLWSRPWGGHMYENSGHMYSDDFYAEPL